MLAETATLTTTDMTRDVHLCTWLCEWEVAWTQAYLRVWTKHLASKGEKHLLQVGERHVLVDVKTLYLMEEAMGACRDGLITIYASWAKNADRGFVSFHVVSLIT